MKRTNILFGVPFLVLSLACADLSKDPPKQPARQDQPTSRYVPVGNNPDIALDTQTGSLCRTIPIEVGMIEKGYRFKGGDPGDKANWEKAGNQNPDKYASLPACSNAGSNVAMTVREWQEWKKAQAEGKKWNPRTGRYE